MKHRHVSANVWALALATLTATFGLSGVLRADDDATQAKMARLEARLAELEANQAKLDSQQTRADAALAQGRAIDAAILDAQQKSRFLAEGFATGWDNGFQIGSDDGTYTLRPYIEFQFRNVTNHTGGDDDFGSATDDGNDTLTNGFEMRRLKFGFRGNAISKDFTYNFRFSVDRSTGDTRPDLAYAQYQFAPEWAVRFGQFKLNWTHEETTSDIRQLTVERSLLNQIAGGSNSSYVQGVSLLYGSKDNPLHGELAFTDGDNTANTNFQDSNPPTGYQDFGVAARVDYKIFGDWKSYDDFTALANKADLLVVGGGVDWAEGGDGDVYRLTADAQYENTTGLSAYGAAIYTIADSASFDNVLDKSIGGLAQVGYLLPNAKNWEVFGRYDVLVLDEDVGGEDTFHEATVGVNRYVAGHNAKLTLDVGYLPNGSPETAGGLGVTNNTQEQIVVRAQFQLVL